jgi:elongation factor P
MYSTSDFRNGLKIEWEGTPYVIVEFQHVKPGKGSAFVRTKIKNLLTGRVLDPTFKSGEKFEKPDLEEKEMEYLYIEGEECHFMDTTNYEQITISKEQVSDQLQWLKENTPCQLLFWRGKPITIQLPFFIDLVITYCEPGMRGDTATGASKPATLETGAVVHVPLFVNQGDKIKIDTRNGSYVERV